MSSTTYDVRRGRLQTYFNATAVDQWAQLTSTAPVSRIRQTVRAGRDRMREMLLDWLPGGLDGARLLDAGCGTGALALQAALASANPTDRILVFGSFYTVGGVLQQGLPRLSGAHLASS
jgi:magnesium-protoporphyrin O-methyltransferase